MTQAILVSPTEHHPALRSLGRSSSIPEKNGCDVIILLSNRQYLGFQRKEVSDLLSSLRDGRLGFEISQMKSSRLLTACHLIIEGKILWTTDGFMLSNVLSLSRKQWDLLLLALQNEGIFLLFSESASDTAVLCTHVADYYSKSSHLSLARRPKPSGEWGKATSEQYAIHLLQSFPGVGAGLAKAIYDHFSRAPISWDVTAIDLARVPGIGLKRAEQLIGSLRKGKT